MDLYFQGLASLNRGVNLENMAQARGFFERPCRARPRQYGRSAWGRAGRLLGGRRVSFGRPGRAPGGGRSGCVAKVLSVRPNDALAHEIMGAILNQTKRSDQGVAELERALALDPNLATAHGDIGLAKILPGVALMKPRLMKKKPCALSSARQFCLAMAALRVGAAKMALGANEEAVALFRRSIEINRTSPLPSFLPRGGAGEFLGELEEAHSETKAGLALDPGFTIMRFPQWQRERRAALRRHAKGRCAGRVSEGTGRGRRRAPA